MRSAPAATEAKAENIGVTKAAMPGAKCFVSAMLAGAFIGFGGMYFCTFLGDTTMAFGVQRLVGGLCFCLGLCLVLCCGAELFTGNVLMVCAKASKKITFGGLFRNWGIVWVGNLAGSLLAMFIIFMSNLQGMNGGAVGEAFVSVAAGKVSLAPEVLFFKAILCNILVCLAVWIGFSSKTTADKVLGILLPISAFVACGFEPLRGEYVLPSHGPGAQRPRLRRGRCGDAGGRCLQPRGSPRSATSSAVFWWVWPTGSSTTRSRRSRS